MTFEQWIHDQEGDYPRRTAARQHVYDEFFVPRGAQLSDPIEAHLPYVDYLRRIFGHMQTLFDNEQMEELL